MINLEIVLSCLLALYIFTGLIIFIIGVVDLIDNRGDLVSSILFLILSTIFSPIYLAIFILDIYNNIMRKR